MAYMAETNGAKRSKLDDETRNHSSHHQNQPSWNNMDNEDGGGGGGGGRRKREESERVNHILLFTILNPMYPITTDVLHTISSPHGKVERIVVFKKHGIQAMVEFDSIDCAKRAKDSLHGADIYSGCCTLKIDFAKPSKLNVYKNDNESFDYTNPNLGVSKEGRPGPLLQEPRFGQNPIRFNQRTAGSMEPLRGQVPFANGGGGGSSGNYDRYENGYGSRSLNGPGGGGGGTSGGAGGPAAYHDTPPYERYPAERGYVSGGPKDDYSYRNGPMRSSPPALADVPSGGVGGPRPMQQGAVMMVYGLCKDRINAERLFNLFCLYGNVVRVKFLKSKEGCAMIQMGDALSVDRAMSNFNNTFMFGSKVQLGYSKQAFLSDVQTPHTLPDASPSFKDFMGNKNNRFLNPEMASKNRIQPPTKTLHFFNTPPMSFGENEMREVFLEAEAPSPKSVKFFQSKSERSSSGLIEFESLTDSVEGLAIMNHYPIKCPGGKFPFILKLCFSSSRNPQNRMDDRGSD
ncbi:heterogeneous nuclear ribonucleoprotein L isoform X2 [Folsomia candida]|uniref:heterogeneous nuclear ribonucleoprotein L isoform X2 n=1 Tax=Folsomia candida TaxID=158441 RepID=UPI000B900793|nr:heterogeneous nuclear ribonucleoprotein L isoform X2 [Folsomia candida]